MEYYIAAFRSRAETYEFAAIVRSYNFFCEIINTPRQAGLNCGISLKFYEDAFKIAVEILRRRKFDSFNGFFKIIQSGRKIQVIPL